MASLSRFSLDAKYALVIGGTSGIGKAIARGYLEAGARVIVAGRDSEKLGRALADLAPHGEVYGYQADVSDQAGLRGLVGITLAHHGRIDVLVNCQGITLLKAAEEFTPEDWDMIINTDLKSVFFACTEVGRHMLGRGSGAILNIASLASHRGWPRSALYAIAKTGVLSLTQTLAAEWAARGVRVNAISPGFFMTELNRATRCHRNAKRWRSRARLPAALARSMNWSAQPFILRRRPPLLSPAKRLRWTAAFWQAAFNRPARRRAC